MSNEKTKQEEIEKLDFDDVELNFEVKNIKIEPTDVESKNENSTSSVIPKDDEVMEMPLEGVSNKTSKDDEVMGTPSEVVSNKTSKDDEVMGTPSEGVSNKTSKDDEVMGTPSAGVPNNSSKDDKINNFTDSQKPRGLRDKIDDAKQKYQDRKDKFNDAKDKVKNAPDNLKKKRDELKDKWNNRPKNAKELGNRAKNAGKNLGKNIKQRTKDGIKQGAQNAFNSSRTGQAINKGKDLVDKGKKTVEGAKKAGKTIKGTIKFFSTPAGWWTLAGIAIGLLIMVIIIMVPSLFASGSPGVGGEVQDEENYSKYSEVDQKTINNLKKIYEKYPTGDPTYAMAATLYPYIEEMQNGNVSSLRGKTNDEKEDSEDIYDEADLQDNEQDGIEEAKDDENDTISDDMYLELLREKKYMNKFKKLLKESRDGEKEFTKFLKDKWFDKDKGYKELFDGVDSDEELKDAIIDDILNQKDDFLVYFYENNVCSVNMSSIGTVEIDEMLKGNILVDVKVSSCTTGKDVWNCESMYDTPITMEKYVKGVTYEEIGVSGSSDVEKVKAQMVAAKSYIIGRSKSMGWGTKQDDAGNYIITIRANTNDQDYCDIDLGCKSGKTEVRSGSAHRSSVDSDTRAILDEAWEATKNIYTYNTDKKTTAGEFCQNRTGVCDFCNKGTCLAHEELSNYKNTNYDKILGEQYSKYALITVQGDYADASIASGETCSVSGLGIPDDQFKFYYQFDYPDVAFCGATNHVNSCASGSNSICSSGCGITSLAMLVSNLSNDTSFDPIAANEEGKNNGGCAVGSGTYDKLFTSISEKHEGFSYEKLDNTKEGANKAVAALRDGALIVANVQANSPFTSGGHWIVLRGITEDGMVKVADPISKERSTTGTYYIEDFIDKNWLDGHNWYAIYGPKSSEIKVNNDASSEQGAAGEIIDTENGIKNKFFAPIQNSKLKMYGKNATNDNKYHDLGASCGTNVYSPEDGTATFKTITKNGKIASYGNVVEITTSDGYKFILSHLKSFVGYNVKYGSEGTYPSSCGNGGCNTYEYGSRVVKKGEKIGLSGTSGNSTGCHLHIEIWKNETRLEPSGLLGYGVQ